MPTLFTNFVHTLRHVVIHWPLMLSNKQRDSWTHVNKASRIVYYRYNNADWRVSLSMAPPTLWKWSETLYFRLYLGTDLFLMCYNFLLQLPHHCHNLSEALLFGHVFVKSGSPGFCQLQHRWMKKVPALVATLARSPIVLGVGNHIAKLSTWCFHDIQSHWQQQQVHLYVVYKVASHFIK